MGVGHTERLGFLDKSDEEIEYQDWVISNKLGIFERDLERLLFLA